MATWIVHLRVAENLLGRIAGLDGEQLGIGSIAPDSGIPDENWENFDPPAEVLHFQSSKIEERHCNDLDFYRLYLKGFPWPSEDTGKFSFLMGYFFHLVTDNLWGERIGLPTEKLFDERFKGEFESLDEYFREVKRDWYGLDFYYVRDNPDSFFWQSFLESDIKSTYVDFLPEEGLGQRVEYIKEFYQRQDEAVEKIYARPYVFLSKGEMDGFVKETSELLFRVYELIWEKGLDVGNGETVLEKI